MIANNTFSQVSHDSIIRIDPLFQNKGEIYFKFNVNSKTELNNISRIISIDNVENMTVYAYANEKTFKKFREYIRKYNYDCTIFDHPSDGFKPKMYDSYNKAYKSWDAYPTYNAYETMMYQFAIDYPTICRIDTIGILNSGRKLLVAKITDNPDQEEDEPEFLYTSSIHGNETTGYILMLRLIDYLLSNYETNTSVKNLVNNIEIWINPLANPDGTYAGGNNSVSGAQRFNANYVDLNRNYPDPEDGQHPDGNSWQPETQFFMSFADNNHIDMSANFHGGVEVVNYPWDTWSQLTADDSWWFLLSDRYADTAQANSPSTYFDGYNDGITNGYQWYSISGGRQDYMNYFHNCREVTLEISNQKLLPTTQLLAHWDYNFLSMINYMKQSLYGLRGIITDSITNLPLLGKVYIAGHDIDSSHVYSSLPIGDYHRYLYSGNYTLTYSATGYHPKNFSNINIANDSTTWVDVQLVPIGINNEIINSDNNNFTLFPNPATSTIIISFNNNSGKDFYIELIDISGHQLLIRKYDSKTTRIKYNISKYESGFYFIRMIMNDKVYSKKFLIMK